MRLTAGQCKLAQDHIRLVRGIIHSRWLYVEDPDALVSDAFWGLVESARDYDPAKGIPFGAYARKRIEWAIKDGRRVRDSMRRGDRAIENVVTRVTDKLTQQLERTPTEAELARALGVTERRLCRHRANTYAAHMRSLNELLDEAVTRDAMTLTDTLRDQTPTAEEQLTSAPELYEALDQLEPPERFLIVMHYWQNKRLQDIAEMLGVHPSRASQIKSRAIRKLRLHIEGK